MGSTKQCRKHKPTKLHLFSSRDDWRKRGEPAEARVLRYLLITIQKAVPSLSIAGFSVSGQRSCCRTARADQLVAMLAEGMPCMCRRSCGPRKTETREIETICTSAFALAPQESAKPCRRGQLAPAKCRCPTLGTLRLLLVACPAASLLEDRGAPDLPNPARL